MEDMTYGTFPPESMDEGLLAAKSRLREASLILDTANKDYLSAIAAHISIVAEIRNWSGEYPDLNAYRT